MPDDAQAAPSGEKKYWQDRRPLSAATSSPGLSADQLRQQRQRQPVRPASMSLVRTIPNLRHPIAAFVLAILAIIFIGVGLLAATGEGALPKPPLQLADCAQATATLLGAPGAQFTVSFPAGARVSGISNNWCLYGYTADNGDAARPLQFGVSATSGPVRVNGIIVRTRGTPDWANASNTTLVARDGATGSEAFQCDQQTDWCYGWLRVSRSRATWVVSASSDSANLPTIEAFMRSFQPAP